MIGGAAVYAAALALADRLEVTELDLDVAGDTTAPVPGPEWRRTAVDPATGWHAGADGTRYRFVTLTRTA